MPNYQDEYRYRPYGAIELKMTYQRNMMIANATVISLIASMLISAWALSLGKMDVITPIDGRDHSRDTISVTLTDPNRIHITRGGGPRPVLSDMQGWNLTPVEDSLVLDDRESENMRQRGLVGDPGDTGTIGFGENPDPIVVGEPVEDIPEYGKFVSTEKLPVLIDAAKPEYPAMARRLGITGKGSIAALVGSDGKVREAKIVRSTGSDALDSAAVIAAFKNVFSPAIQNGRPISIWVTYAVEFKLDE